MGLFTKVKDHYHKGQVIGVVALYISRHSLLELEGGSGLDLATKVVSQLWSTLPDIYSSNSHIPSKYASATLALSFASSRSWSTPYTKIIISECLISISKDLSSIELTQFDISLLNEHSPGSLLLSKPRQTVYDLIDRETLRYTNEYQEFDSWFQAFQLGILSHDPDDDVQCPSHYSHTIEQEPLHRAFKEGIEPKSFGYEVSKWLAWGLD